MSNSDNESEISGTGMPSPKMEQIANADLFAQPVIKKLMNKFASVTLS